MIEQCFARTSVITQLQRGPLGSHLDALATTLAQHGYAPDSIRRVLRASDQFGQWLAPHGYTIADVDETLVSHDALQGHPCVARERYGGKVAVCDRDRTLLRY
jgi:hypothetical protein